MYIHAIGTDKVVDSMHNLDFIVYAANHIERVEAELAAALRLLKDASRFMDSEGRLGKLTIAFLAQHAEEGEAGTEKPGGGSTPSPGSGVE